MPIRLDESRRAMWKLRRCTSVPRLNEATERPVRAVLFLASILVLRIALRRKFSSLRVAPPRHSSQHPERIRPSTQFC